MSKSHSGLSRRKFLTTAAGAVAMLHAAGDGAAHEDDPRIAQVMSGTIGIDMHNHVYPAGTGQRRRSPW